MALKELEVRYATRPQKDYKLTDSKGLYLLVRPNGSKLWRQHLDRSDLRLPLKG